MVKNRKNCGKKLVSRIGELTSSIFKRSREEVFEEMDLIELDLFAIMVMDTYDEIKRKIDDRYLENLIKLPTKEIEDILWVHLRGRIKRAPRTIEALTSELTRRSLFNDSKKSEIKNIRRSSDAVQKPKSKSKRRRKTT